MTPELTHGIDDGDTASRTAWAGRRDGEAASRPAEPRAGFIFPPWGHIGPAVRRLSRLLHAFWLRRSLRKLSDHQLRDAGIDPTLAGRGRAADVAVDPNIGSGY